MRRPLSWGQDDSLAEKVEAGAAIHLAFDHLDPVDVALDRAGAVGQGQAVAHGGVVLLEPGGEGVQVGLVIGWTCPTVTGTTSCGSGCSIPRQPCYQGHHGP